MEWKIITKEIRNDKGLIVVIETDEQIDKVGNIYQKQGGVIPKACQKCKKEFDAILEQKPIIQEVPFYKCKDCNFKDPSANKALDHKLLEENHKLTQTKKERIVGFKTQLIGRKANITISKKDVLILCDDCK